MHWLECLSGFFNLQPIIQISKFFLSFLMFTKEVPHMLSSQFPQCQSIMTFFFKILTSLSAYSEFVSYFADMNSYAPIFKIFFSPLDIYCKESPLQLQMELIDLPCSEYLKTKFLVTSPISIKTTCFHPDDSLTLFSKPCK